jgi:hypothetical protein
MGVIKSFNEIKNAVDDCKYRVDGWTLFVGQRATGEIYLQIHMVQPCTKTGHVQSWTGRKWPLSQFMTRSEIVQTVFKAVMTAIEHEARERFHYRGRPIFGPHYDVDKLWSMATEENEDVRLPNEFTQVER